MTETLARLNAALAGRYRIERELGGGGMSRVFLARETALGREVVVKVLAQELAAGVSAERFTREIATAARLQQANIVPVLSAGDADGVAYYTMPFVRGESLRARMTGGIPLSMGERVSILRDVARALAYAHGEGVVHRDIKPENVLLSHGTAVVTDFGIAKAISAARTQDGSGAVTLTQAGGAIGTPAYMAPEQAVGDAVDHRTDLYAWGVMAYELLSGAHPFGRHVTPQTLITAHLTETPAQFKPSDAVPPALGALVFRCLEKEPGRRPGSAAELVAALDQVTTSGVSGPQVAVPARSRGRWLALAVVGVLLLAFAAWRLSMPRGPAAKFVSEKSLAVLPFESVGGDTANAYFAEGMGDELTTKLSQLPGLRVSGRSSAIRFKGKGASAKEVGAALNVASVLDGTVRRAGGRVRVTAQLTSATDGLVQWSESYEREMKDVFALQDELARAIVSALQVRLAAGTERPAANSGTTNLEAYDLYLRGLYLYRRRGTNLLRAAELLEQAIAKDSTFARAHAILATVLLTQPYYLPVNVDEIVPRARKIAQRAVELDPKLSEAHQALGVSYNLYDWSAAEREERTAVALDPNSAEARYRLGFLLISIGRTTESISEFEHAKALDPLYVLPASYLAYALAIVGRNAEAVAEARRAVELDSTNLATLSLAGLVYRQAGQTSEALDVARRVLGMTNDPRRIGFIIPILVDAGQEPRARALVAKLEALPPTTPGRNSGLAMAYLGLRDTTRALAAMERAVALPGGDLLFATAPADPTYDPVRTSPRFAGVLRRLNLDVALLNQPKGGRPQP